MTKKLNPLITIHDLATDKIIEREMTNEEFVVYQEDQTRETARQTEAKAQAIAKAALLERLGMTAEEAALLLG